MENNKNVMMGLLAVGLCLGLLWGVSPSMAASSFQTENQKKTNTLRSFKTPAMQRYIQPATKSSMAAPKLEKSFMPNSKAATKNPLIFKPGYDVKRLNDNMSKVYHSDAGRAPAKIDIGKPVILNPKQVQGNTKAAAQTGSGGWGAGYGKAPSNPNFGGYGENGGSGVVPPGPARAPGSTPPPSAQSNQQQNTVELPIGGGNVALPAPAPGSTPPPQAPSNDPLLNCLASGGGLGCFR